MPTVNRSFGWSMRETAVAGIVRSVESYGIFVELTPNLAGLAELKENVHAGQQASVFIKSILPNRMKVIKAHRKAICRVEKYPCRPPFAVLNHANTVNGCDYFASLSLDFSSPLFFALSSMTYLLSLKSQTTRFPKRCSRAT